MESHDLNAQQWKKIATLWRHLAEISGADVERARRKASQALIEFFDASHVLMVIQRRVAPASFPLGGLRPVLSRDFGPDTERRRQITQEWMKSEPGLASDPILQRVVEGIGELRTVGHRGELRDEAWEQAPVRRLLERLGVEDRLNGIVPLGQEVEVSFCVDRPTGAPHFDDEDRRLMLSIIEGLRPLAANFVRSHGLMPGQRRLTLEEQHVLQLLLSDLTESELTDALDLTAAQLSALTGEIYRKSGVDDRVGLLHLWLDGVNEGQRLSEEARGADVSLLVESPVDQVLETLRGLRPSDFDIETVARRMSRSVRSLQRELRDAGASYRDLVDSVRQEIAEELLAQPSLSITEVALRLGYEQVSSFNRAMRRWADSSPGEVRRELLQKCDAHDS